MMSSTSQATPVVIQEGIPPAAAAPAVGGGAHHDAHVGPRGASASAHAPAAGGLVPSAAVEVSSSPLVVPPAPAATRGPVPAAVLSSPPPTVQHMAPPPPGPSGPVSFTTAALALLPLMFLASSLLPKLYRSIVFVPAQLATGTHVWTLVLNVVAEPHLFGLVLTMILFSAYGPTVERERGSSAVVNVCVFATLSSVLLTIVASGVLQGITNQHWVAAAFGGSTPAAAAALMCAWQRAPQGPLLAVSMTDGGLDGSPIRSGGGTVWSLSALLRTAAPAVAARLQQFRLQYAPFAVLCLTVAHDVIFNADPPTEAEAAAEVITGGPVSLPVLFGVFSSWFYLRFIARTLKAVAPSLHDRSNPLETTAVVGSSVVNVTAGVASGAMEFTRGDPAPTMAFHMLFPPPLQRPVQLLGAAVFPAVHCCGLGTAVADAARLRARVEANIRQYDGGNGGSGGRDGVARETTGKPLPGSTQTEAERRRVAALQALTARMERARAVEAAAADAGPDAGDDLGEIRL